MKNENIETLISIQPYFVLDSDDFCQHILTEKGISHFFSFSNKSGLDICVPLIVDGCSNIIFEYNNGILRTHFIGSTLERRTFSVKKGADYFGVRLMPTGALFVNNVDIKDTIGKIIILDDLEYTKDFCALMSEQKDFESRMTTFLSEYPKFYDKSKRCDCRFDLFTQIADLIIQRRGRIKIGELESLSGYSSRYINKIFDKELGMSAKQLCSTVKFQFLLSDLNEGNMDNLTSISSEYNFYDQSHFIHEFKEYSGKTPKEYKNEVTERKYKTCVKTI